MTKQPKRRLLAVAGGLAALVGLTLFSGAGSAASQAVPTNTTEPRILGEARIGQTLTAVRGLWTGSKLLFKGTCCESFM